jgi:hypothetical protein
MFDCLIKSKYDKKWNILIFYPNLRLYTKTIVPYLLCILNFRGPPQGLQSCPRFAESSTESDCVARVRFSNWFCKAVSILQQFLNKGF